MQLAAVDALLKRPYVWWLFITPLTSMDMLIVEFQWARPHTWRIVANTKL